MTMSTSWPSHRTSTKAAWPVQYLRPYHSTYYVIGVCEAAGFIFLIGLMILVACSDVLKLFGK